jgi:hypothetical protein
MLYFRKIKFTSIKYIVFNDENKAELQVHIRIFLWKFFSFIVVVMGAHCDIYKFLSIYHSWIHLSIILL